MHIDCNCAPNSSVHGYLHAFRRVWRVQLGFPRHGAEHVSGSRQGAQSFILSTNHFRRPTYSLVITTACYRLNQSPLHICTVPPTAFLALLFLHQPTPHSSPSFLSDRTISKPLRRLTTHFTHTQTQSHASYPSFENAVIYIIIIIIIITHTPFIQRAAFGFAKSFLYIYIVYPIYSHTKSSLIPFAWVSLSSAFARLFRARQSTRAWGRWNLPTFFYSVSGQSLYCDL